MEKNKTSILVHFLLSLFFCYFLNKQIYWLTMLLIFKRIKACVSPKNILCVETSSEKPLSFIILALLSFSEKSEISVPRQISSIHCCFFFFFFVNDWAVLACRSGDRKCGTSVDDLCVVAEISCKCGRYRSTYRTRRMGLNQMRHWDFLLNFLFLSLPLVAPFYLFLPGYFRLGEGTDMENRCYSWTIQLWSLWTVLPWELATASNFLRPLPRAVSLQLHTRPASKSVVLKGDAWEKDIRKDMQMG